MTEKILQAKRKHHYVWKKYLSRWSPDDDGKIYYTTSTRKIIHDSLSGLAMQKDFYQIKELTANEINIIKAFLKPLSKALQDTYLSLLNDILKIQHIQSLYQWEGKNDEEVKKLFLSAKCNIIENIHGGHESNVTSIIAALANGELSILEDTKNMGSFMAFLGLQMFRTKKIKDRVLNLQPRETNVEKFVAGTMQNIWWFMSYVFGANLGESLYFDRHQYTHSLLINDTNISFITSDQPVINVHECASNADTHPPEKMDLYYPIAPKVAYLISEAGRFRPGKIGLTVRDVNELNVKMAKKSNNSIFGNSELILGKYIKYIIPGKRFAEHFP